MKYRRYRELSNGQFVLFRANREWNQNKTEIWAVCVAIGDNKKHCKFVRDGKSSGHCGLEGLRILVMILKEFIELLETSNRSYQIDVCGSDERRKEAYRYLKRLGFEEGYLLSDPDWYLWRKK